MGRTTPSIEGEGQGQKTTYGRSPKKPTVGRLTDLPWVVEATYRRSLLGSFREANLEGLEWASFTPQVAQARKPCSLPSETLGAGRSLHHI